LASYGRGAYELRSIDGFELFSTPATRTVIPGGATSVAINCRANNSSDQLVELSAEISPAGKGITATLSANKIAAGGHEVIDLKVAPTAPLANYTVTITGKSGQTVRKTTAIINVAVPDFSLDFESNPLIIRRGEKSGFVLNINRVGGLTGKISVTAPDTRAIKFKLTPTVLATTDAAIFYRFTLKKSAPVGPQQLTFTGTDENGKVHTGVLNLIIQ
jgi:hypothetical protein